TSQNLGPKPVHVFSRKSSPHLVRGLALPRAEHERPWLLGDLARVHPKSPSTVIAHEFSDKGRVSRLGRSWHLITPLRNDYTTPRNHSRAADTARVSDVKAS